MDIKGRELSALVPLVALVIILGVYPKPILEPVDNSVTQLVEVMKIKISEAGNTLMLEKLEEFNTIAGVKK